ncbi:MAG: reductive dehalogenase [Dehalococcoides mccartyi]|uniref:Reductive dehalogenase n=1 Tax=Dehalococcoides mccartyi TaxID=61435 RepID=A0A2J1E0H2_9CHLR|nr:reductive dehalogenase [Dehalococcoides mccartyi]OBW62572.1 MAG: reductive dehalogenase [Dehalococcoides mccartyi]PKH47938.1 reductive dehalogenase [Dehalococcoides mccartyi]
MSGFHSIVSRRDFMKGLGLAGAGFGTAAATTPMFHDLDEFIASTPDINKRPWYVKERDYGDPTTPIDWNMIERRPYHWARMDPTIPIYDLIKQSGAPVTRWVTAEEKKQEDAILIAKAKSEWPGWEPGGLGYGDIRTTALNQAGAFLGYGMWPSRMNSSGNMVDVASLMLAAGGGIMFDSYAGPKMAKTPEELGIPKWQGTPEENLRTLQAGVRFFGGQNVASFELNENYKKLTFTIDPVGSAIEFGDVEEVVDTPPKKIIPNKCKYVFMWSMTQPYELTRRQSGVYEGIATSTGYERGHIAKVHFQDFVRGLGYQMVGGAGNDSGPAGAFPIFGGLGELSRASYVNDPVYGLTNRVTWSMFTDMPLPDTRPIDFGGRKFCETCGICAEACPFGAINPGEPTWEETNTFGNPGYLGWRCDYTKCPHCPICHGTCPFNALSGSFIHDIVKGTVSTTPVFNTFFKNMEKTFKYGRKDPAEWWELDDYQFGINSSY